MNTPRNRMDNNKYSGINQCRTNGTTIKKQNNKHTSIITVQIVGILFQKVLARTPKY